MRRRRLLAAIGVGSLGGFAGCTSGGLVDGGATDSGSGSDTDSAPEWPSGSYAGYDTTTVEARSADGDRLGTVNAAIADTGDKRYLGLSDAAALPEDAGMLFVFSAEREDITFVMREMDFGIDIVYADAEGTITRVHNAPEPGPNEDGNEQKYPGSGQYVLEVPYKWTDRNGVAVGDTLAFEL
jgi:hypothetical protein